MVLTQLILCGICMTFIDAESNRSQIACIMVVTESDWMRIQNLQNRTGCGVKKSRVRTSLELLLFKCFKIIACNLFVPYSRFYKYLTERPVFSTFECHYCIYCNSNLLRIIVVCYVQPPKLHMRSNS